MRREAIWIPAVIPAETVEDLLEEFTGIDMKKSAFTSDETFDGAFTASGKFVSGGMSFAAGTVTRNDKARVDDGADERNTFVDGLSMNLVGMKGEVEALKELTNNGDIAHDLMLLCHRDDNVEIIDVATIVLVTEVDSDKTVQLVKIDVGQKLAGKITDDDAVAGVAVKETFVVGQGSPIGFRATDGDIFHRVVVDDLIPEKLGDLIELFAVVWAAVNLIFMEII